MTDLIFVLHLLPFMIFTLSINECSQLYRCYIIWDSRKKVLILPALCILATVGQWDLFHPLLRKWMYWAVLMVLVCLQLYEGTYLIDPRAPFTMLLGTNLLLMFLTGSLNYIGSPLVFALMTWFSRPNMVSRTRNAYYPRPKFWKDI